MLDINLGWHTHQLSGNAYMSNTHMCVDRYINHDDTVKEGVLCVCDPLGIIALPACLTTLCDTADGFDTTSCMYKSMFHVPYSMCMLIHAYTTLLDKLKKLAWHWQAPDTMDNTNDAVTTPPPNLTMYPSQHHCAGLPPQRQHAVCVEYAQPPCHRRCSHHATFPLCYVSIMPHSHCATFPLCHVPIVPRSHLPRSHCATFPLCHVPIVPRSHCATFPLCHIPIVPHSHYATFLLCHVPIVPRSHCATFPLCHVPIVPHSHHAAFPLCHIPIMPHSHHATFPSCSVQWGYAPTHNQYPRDTDPWQVGYELAQNDPGVTHAHPYLEPHMSWEGHHLSSSTP